MVLYLYYVVYFWNVFAFMNAALEILCDADTDLSCSLLLIQGQPGPGTYQD